MNVFNCIITVRCKAGSATADCIFNEQNLHSKEICLSRAQKITGLKNIHYVCIQPFQSLGINKSKLPEKVEYTYVEIVEKPTKKVDIDDIF